LWWIYFDTVDGSEIRALRENKQIGIYVTWLYIHFPLMIGFTALGVSVEHIVLSNQSLALPSSEKWLLCVSIFVCLLALGVIQMTSAMTTGPVSLSSSVNSRRAIKYTAAIYSIVAAIAILVLVATVKDNIVLLPIFLIGIVAIACTGQVILDLGRHPHHRLPKFR
jgi:low temperature requirement protein LtrA